MYRRKHTTQIFLIAEAAFINMVDRIMTVTKINQACVGCSDDCDHEG